MIIIQVSRMHLIENDSRNLDFIKVVNSLDDVQSLMYNVNSLINDFFISSYYQFIHIIINHFT